MCGITGFIDRSLQPSADELSGLVTRMSDTLTHRGPDDSGAWVEPRAGAALGFRRLAILDLSPSGHQPMLSADERWVIIFNGEVYNYQELRSQLAGLGHAFRGTSDTEVMLAAVCQWGVRAAVQRFNGMFALALYDRAERVLYLVRDRLGIKPLYYGWFGPVLLFGSELKALRAHPSFQGEIDRDALALYLRHNCIPAPYSIYRSVRKLLPGQILTVRVEDGQPGTSEIYWSARETAISGQANLFRGNEQEALDELDGLLRDSVRQRMIADVPLGAFLSGGINSSTIVALMQSQSTLPVKTFTIGFREGGFDEAVHARQVAARLGTQHTELYVSPQETLDVIPRLPALYDEPFADASQIPTFLVAQMARQHVTVSLSGDGGDELFGGYSRYAWIQRVSQGGSLLRAAQRCAASLGKRLPPRAWDLAGLALPASQRPFEFSTRIYKLLEIMACATPEEMYRVLTSQWTQPAALLRAGTEPATIFTTREDWLDLPVIQRIMYFDLVSYLPDDILAKVDRATMGASLEGRMPFLDDHHVVEFAWRLPLAYKIRAGTGKWILRQLLHRYVPAGLVERPKQGFAVPIDSWLRGPLRAWAADLLDEGRLRREGFFDPLPIRQKWQEHLAERRNWQYDLWGILMFQAWYAETHR